MIFGTYGGPLGDGLTQTVVTERDGSRTPCCATPVIADLPPHRLFRGRCLKRELHAELVIGGYRRSRPRCRLRCRRSVEPQQQARRWLAGARAQRARRPRAAVSRPIRRARSSGRPRDATSGASIGLRRAPVWASTSSGGVASPGNTAEPGAVRTAAAARCSRTAARPSRRGRLRDPAGRGSTRRGGRRPRRRATPGPREIFAASVFTARRPRSSVHWVPYTLSASTTRSTAAATALRRRMASAAARMSVMATIVSARSSAAGWGPRHEAVQPLEAPRHLVEALRRRHDHPSRERQSRLLRHRAAEDRDRCRRRDADHRWRSPDVGEQRDRRDRKRDHRVCRIALVASRRRRCG